jgi:hypothetical protein
LQAEWGKTEEDWGIVAEKKPGWLGAQAVYCLTSPRGAIDIFLHLKGLEDWGLCDARALQEETASGVPYRGLSDHDMLKCQQAIDESARKPDRIRVLEEAIRKEQDREEP